jgi:hypothetical protein
MLNALLGKDRANHAATQPDSRARHVSDVGVRRS